MGDRTRQSVKVSVGTIWRHNCTALCSWCSWCTVRTRPGFRPGVDLRSGTSLGERFLGDVARKGLIAQSVTPPPPIGRLACHQAPLAAKNQESGHRISNQCDFLCAKITLVKTFGSIPHEFSLKVGFWLLLTILFKFFTSNITGETLPGDKYLEEI